MRLSRVVGVGGPVGFLLASVGYAVSVTMARTFVSLESHCVQACPVVRVEGFQFHHFYYGLILSTVSLGMLLRGSGHSRRDRKSTRLNSSHVRISYAVFCLKKKKTTTSARLLFLHKT